MSSPDREPHTTVVMPELPKCDLCKSKGEDRTASYDGATKMGPWAYMCEEHFRQYGVGLGLGQGQELVLPD